MSSLLPPPGSRGPALFLIAVNLIPLAGVLFWGWSLFQVVALYWMENVIVGAVNLLKMGMSCGGIGAEPEARTAVPPGITGRQALLANHASKFFLMPFFTVHYGMFCLVHGMFVATLLGKMELHQERGFFGALSSLFTKALADGGWLAAAGLAAGHLVAFFQDFIFNGEYRRASAHQMMAAPYGRIVVLHIAILLGSFLILALGSPVMLLVLLVAGKIVLDLKIHRRAQARKQADAGQPQ